MKCYFVWYDCLKFTNAYQQRNHNIRTFVLQITIYSWRHGSIDISWYTSWWRHQMETFSTLLALCAGKLPVTGEFPSQRTVTRSFDVFFDLRLNKRLSKQWWGWWIETPLRPSWRHCNDILIPSKTKKLILSIIFTLSFYVLISGN